MVPLTDKHRLQIAHRVTLTRAVDTEPASSSYATGFIVDRSRGIMCVRLQILCQKQLLHPACGILHPACYHFHSASYRQDTQTDGPFSSACSLTNRHVVTPGVCLCFRAYVAHTLRLHFCASKFGFFSS